MTFYPIQGILLKMIPYSDKAWVCRIFSLEEGLISLYITQTKAKGAGLAALNLVEFVVRPTRGEVWKCKEAKLLNGFLGLRKSFNALQTAGDMAAAILFSQMEEKPTPSLFFLFVDYLKRLEKGSDPAKIIASFYLKILRLEGVWSEEIPSRAFSSQEWQICLALAHCRTGKEMHSIPDNKSAYEKAKRLFYQRVGE